LHQRTSDLGLLVADAVLRRGVAEDGGVMYEGDVHGVSNAQRHWWCQAEAMVGFQDAFEQHGDKKYSHAAKACWSYIERHHVDPNGGDWLKVLDAEGRPLPGSVKAGPWECPYHHARACFEMIARLERDRGKA
jgi:mannobiose 2-epimerase